MLFKLVAPSFCKKVADLNEQSSRRVWSAVRHIETPGYEFVD